MKVQYASDQHLEFYDNSVFTARSPLKVAGDVLVLAGDTLPRREFETYRQHRFVVLDDDELLPRYKGKIINHHRKGSEPGF